MEIDAAVYTAAARIEKIAALIRYEGDAAKIEELFADIKAHAEDELSYLHDQLEGY